MAKVNKAQFIDSLASRLDGDRKRAAAAVEAFIDTVYSHVVRGEQVALTGFGIFEKRDRAARTARNPATGATVKVKKTSVPAFRAGAEFKALANGSKKIAKAPAKKATSAAKATASGRASTAKAPAKKANTAKAPAKKAAASKAPAKKAPAKKAAASKAPAKKAPAKKAAAKSAR